MNLLKKAVPLVLIVADIATIALSIFLAYESRELFLAPNDIPLSHYILFLPMYFPIVLFIFSGLYRYRFDFWHESKYIAKSTAFSLLLVLSYLAVTRSVENYSRFVILASFVFMTLLLPLQKRLVKYLLFKAGVWKKPAKYIGSGEVYDKSVFENYYMGYIKSKNADTVFINSQEIEPNKVEKLLKKEILSHHELYFIPILKDFNLADSVIFELINSRQNLILLKNRLENRMNIVIKESSDKILGGISFVLLLPLLGVAALLVYMENPDAPVLFYQRRVAKGGGKFTLLKFRTMHPDSKKILKRYFEENPEGYEEYKKYKKLRNDPRVTRVGAFLRRYSLDELPQIINVIKGDMSLVGPRPYMAGELKELGEDKEIILSVKPGITGLWQVSGRNRLTFEERKKMDLWYVYNWSLWKDIVILLKTFKAIITKDGAF